MRQVSAVHYEDLYPKSFIAFRKKYLPLLKKGGEHRRYYVQFTNFMDDTRSKKPYEDPYHHDPVAIYGYPLEYVLKHPADIWYGNQAKYLRVLTERKSSNTLLLQYMTESGASNVLYKMGLPYDSMDKARLLWPDRVGKGTGSIGRAFFQAMQMDMSGIGKIPRSKDQRRELAKGVKVRSGKEQTALLRKAGFDAIEDTARNQKTAVINPREPEQIAFLHRNAFDVVEVIPLKLSQKKTGVGTSQDPSYLAPKLAAMIATRIGDRIVDRDEYGRTFWTAAGREIAVKFEYHPSYYEGKKLGEKKHKEVKLHSPYLMKVDLLSERGTFSPMATNSEKFTDLADDVADRFNSAEPVEGFKPISKASRASEKEAATRAYRQKEKEKKYEDLKRWVPGYLSEIAEVAQRLGLPFTQAEYFNSSDETRELLNNILMLVGRYLSNEMHRVEKRLHEEDPKAWDWYSKYDREKAIKEVKQAIDYVAEDVDASPALIKEMAGLYEASLNWMLDNKKWHYQHPAAFFSFLLRDMKESEPEAVSAASKLIAEAAALLSGGKVSGYLVNDVIQLKDYLLMDDAGKGQEIAFKAWPLFVGWAEETQPEGVDVDGLSANDMDADTSFDDVPEAVFAAFWKWFDKRQYKIEDYLAPALQPTFLYMEFERIVKGEWLVHFSEKASDIARQGFRYGIDDVTTLGLTTHFIKKSRSGFNFSYLAGDAVRYGKGDFDGDTSGDSWKYGKHAVMFRANGVKVYHYTDEEPQVIFLGSTAKDIVELENTEDGWVVVGKNGPVFKSGDLGSSKDGLQRCIDWVETNYSQYRNKLNQQEKAVDQKTKQKIAASLRAAANEILASADKALFEVRTNFPEADMWVIRKGTLEKVGSVTKTFSPENIGVKVLATDVVLPDYLYYVLMHLHMKGFFKSRAKGTTNLQNITVKDVNDALGLLRPAQVQAATQKLKAAEAAEEEDDKVAVWDKLGLKAAKIAFTKMKAEQIDLLTTALYAAVRHRNPLKKLSAQEIAYLTEFFSTNYSDKALWAGAKAVAQQAASIEQTDSDTAADHMHAWLVRMLSLIPGAIAVYLNKTDKKAAQEFRAKRKALLRKTRME